MLVWKTFSFTMLLGLIESTSTPGRPSPVPSRTGNNPLVDTSSVLQLRANNNLSEPATALSDLLISQKKSPNDYPIDPYQLRVPGTTTSLIFSKYGPPVSCETFLDLTARAQYEIVRAVVVARGDGPVSRPNFEWSEKKLFIRISRPLAQDDMTWLMLADTLEGTRGFFAGLRGWFETEITILDDAAGPVGSGSVTF